MCNQTRQAAASNIRLNANIAPPHFSAILVSMSIAPVTIPAAHSSERQQAIMQIVRKRVFGIERRHTSQRPDQARPGFRLDAEPVAIRLDRYATAGALGLR
jgi:hypothetical protein